MGFKHPWQCLEKNDRKLFLQDLHRKHKGGLIYNSSAGHKRTSILSCCFDFLWQKTWMICNKPELSRYNFQGCFISYLFLKFVSIFETQLTKILPVPVCPEISSPAQSLASLMKSPSDEASGFCPWLVRLLIMARRDDLMILKWHRVHRFWQDRY